MLNYVVDPRLITPLIPAGTEIDFENGETFLSVVGFLFLDTRLLGLPIPLHRDFEEVNLRFYVRRKSADTWRRGVVFIRELVPRRAIAFVARTFYGENYVAVPMKHEIEHLDAEFEGGILVATRPQMGITQNDGDWRGATYSSRIARRIYHRTLLGLHWPCGAAAANTAWNIRAGKFGMRPDSNSMPTLQLSTASNSPKH